MAYLSIPKERTPNCNQRKKRQMPVIRWLFITGSIFLLFLVSQGRGAFSSFLLSSLAHLAFVLLINLDKVLQPATCLEA